MRRDEPEVLQVESLDTMPVRQLDVVPSPAQEIVRVDDETNRVWRKEKEKQQLIERRREHRFFIFQAYTRHILSTLSVIMGLMGGVLILSFAGYTMFTSHDEHVRAEALKYVAAYAAGALSLTSAKAGRAMLSGRGNKS